MIALSGRHKIVDIITTATSSLWHKSPVTCINPTAQLYCFNKISMTLPPVRLTRQVVLVCGGWEHWIDHADTYSWHYRSLWHQSSSITLEYLLHIALTSGLVERLVRIGLSSRWYICWYHHAIGYMKHNTIKASSNSFWYQSLITHLHHSTLSLRHIGHTHR